MNCRDTQSKLIDLYFDEVEAPIRKSLEEHLHGCGPCWKEYLAIRRSIEFLGSQTGRRDQLDPGLGLKLRRELKKEYGRTLGDLLSFRIPAYVGILALAVVTVFVLALAGSRPVESDPVPQVGRSPDIAAVERTSSDYYDSIQDGFTSVF